MTQQEELEGMPVEEERNRFLTVTVQVPYFGKKETGFKMARRIARILYVRLGENVVVWSDNQPVKPAEDGQ